MQNCQFWLPRCKQDLSITFADAGSVALKLIVQLWPTISPEEANVQARAVCAIVEVTPFSQAKANCLTLEPVLSLCTGYLGL